MFMPVEEDEKTEGNTESKRKKNKGKLFFDGKNCLHGSGK
jgi:hypothetical protein